MDMALAEGLAGGFGLLSNYFMQGAADERKKQRDLNDYKQRAEFAQQLQEQMLEKKMRLAQQYPEYGHFVTNPRDGSVMGFTKFGAAHMLKEGDPEMAKMADDYRKSMIEKNQAAANTEAARQGLLAEQGDANAALASLRRAQEKWGPKSSSSSQKSLTPLQIEKTAEAMAKNAHPELFERPDQLAAFDKEATQAKLAARAEAIQKAKRSLQQSQFSPQAGEFGAFGAAFDDDEEPENQPTEYEDILSY